MKKIRSKIMSGISVLILVFCFIIPVATIFTGCNDSTPEIPALSLDGMQIKNWTNYNAIGVGFETTNFSKQNDTTTYSSMQTSNNLENLVYANNETPKKSKLFGQKKRWTI
jgi:uncharacterized membrane protein